MDQEPADGPTGEDRELTQGSRAEAEDEVGSGEWRPAAADQPFSPQAPDSSSRANRPLWSFDNESGRRTMTLSKDEQKRLDALAAFTESVDPVFAAGFDLVAVQQLRRRRIMLAWYEFWVGLIILFTGSAVAHGLISIGSVISCFGAGLLVCAAATAGQNASGLRRRWQRITARKIRQH